MALLSIRLYGDPVLRKEAEPVTEFGPELEKLAADMLETMQKNDGVGLAAPQVGVSLRFLVMGIPEEKDGEEVYHVFTMANPEIVDEGEETDILEEGCLSLPEITIPVDRPTQVTVRYQDLKGETVELEADGMLAKVVQHEMDHLDGVLITDYLPALKRTMMRSKLKRISEQQPTSARG